MDDWQIEALRLYNAGNDYQKITDALVNLDIVTEPRKARYQEVRRFIYKCRLRHPELITANIASDKKIAEESTVKEEVHQKRNADGTYVSERLIKIIEADLKDDKFLLEAHGFDSDKFDIVNATSNFWSMHSKDDERVNCQSKITVKPKAVGELTLEAIDEHFDSKPIEWTKSEVSISQYSEDGEFLEVCIPDLHGGLFSWRNETGEDYDLHICKERFQKAMDDIRLRCVGKKFCGIWFVTLGDLLNFDNEEQSTTKRTPQQSDGRTAKVHDLIMDMMIDAITMLGNIAPVEVIYLPGNHDLVTGRMLMVAVKMAFRNDENVHFDVEPNPLKARRWGNVMIGWTHGDMPEKNMATWLPQMARKDYGECTAVEVHAGHFHKQSTKEKSVTVKNGNQTFEDGGVVVRYLPTISSASGWAHKQGYAKTVKTIMSFLWNDVTGLREIWFSGVE